MEYGRKDFDDKYLTGEWLTNRTQQPFHPHALVLNESERPPLVPVQSMAVLPGFGPSSSTESSS